ncbi:MAG: acyl-CoA dehydrogenase [Deltaproteobacteria bacterium HGW-Deltaproteobacteria-21]|nr:MAG: acyl-CoA dehydrogenase [Deltaproteobacteria bacterium HGW-Deltaproteobacteria-21]
MKNKADIDYFDTDSLLTGEEKDFRGKVRRFVDKECMPVIAEHFDKGTFPMHLVPGMAEMGLFGLHGDGYGCRKRSHMLYGLICRELGRCDSGLRAMFSVQNSLVMFPIYSFGSEEQRKQWLPGMAKGEIIGCFGLSEPDFGSNPQGMRTKAEKSGNGFILNGTKMWITNGSIAQVAVIWAKLDGDIRGFLVETNTPGFRAAAIRRKFSYRTSPTSQIFLENCEIPEGNALPGARGLKAVLQCLNLARYGVACGALGSAIACYEASETFALERNVFAKPIASYQLVQERLVSMMIEITKAQLITYHLGRLLDENRARHTQISLAKLNNVREAIKIAHIARDILGARGILADNHVIRHLCDLEAVSTLEGTESIHTLILGQDLTGISAFS